MFLKGGGGNNKSKFNKQKMKTAKLHRAKIRKILSEVMSIGHTLSNIAFNTKQRDGVPNDIKESCEKYQKKWDEEWKKLPKWLKYNE